MRKWECMPKHNNESTNGTHKKRKKKRVSSLQKKITEMNTIKQHTLASDTKEVPNPLKGTSKFERTVP
jgi:hypothetical protein